MADASSRGQDLIGKLIQPESLALLRKSDRLVILAAGLVVMAALGAIPALGDHPGAATALALAAMLLVVGLVGLVHWRGHAMGDLEADLLSQAAAAQAVNGEWWQLVSAEDHPGLTYVSIAISNVAERHAMHGITFDEHGRHLARWSSDAIAVKTTTPVELYYMWRGTVFTTGDAELVSGIGRYRFDSVGREQRPLQAEGAFTRGTPGELDFGTARSVEMVRFNEGESQRLADNPDSLPTLAMEAFQRYDLQSGREFSEGRQNAAELTPTPAPPG